MKKLTIGFFTKGYFSLGDVREIDTKKNFEDSDELAKFIEKKLDKYDDHPSIF